MTISSKDSVTHCMAQFVIDTNWETLPQPVQKEATRAWMNWVACATGGAATPSMDAAVMGVLSMGANGEVPLLGRRECVHLADAALLGSLSSSAHTYDDTHLATITHPTGPVASAALATAHQLAACAKPVAGARLLNALMLGMELECRVSCAIAAGGASLGWYMTGLSGGIGAAAAVGKLLELSHDQLMYAIGLAAAQAGGLRATHGSMAITFVPGMAARNGLVAAYLAAADFTCSAIAIDGRNGLLQVLTGEADPSLIRADLGSRFELLQNAYKPYPCGIVIHPAIDACLFLAQEISHADIERIDMRVHPDALNLTWRKLPDNVLDAQVSLFHWMAAAFVQHAAGVAQGELTCVQDPAVRALQQRAHAVADPGLASNQAVVALRLRDGRTRERFTQDATGSVTNPMTDGQLAAKFRGLARLTLDARRADELLKLCLNMPALDDAAEILTTGRVRQ